jgi:hypothetical protein
MSTQDYQNELKDLGSRYTVGTPNYQNEKTQLDTRFANDQKQAEAVFSGNNIKNFMSNATTYNADGKQLLDTLSGLPTGFWNGVKQVGSIKAYSDPNYADQLQQISNFNNEYTSAYESVTGQKPTDDQLLSSANSPAQAAKKYAAMMQFIAGTYGKYVTPYLALTSATGSQTNYGTPQQLRAPAAQAPQQPDWSNFGGGNLPDINLPQVNLPNIPQ